MIELPLVFLGGLLGSSHCIGMCGPLALAIGSNPESARRNLLRQLVYSVGRIFTYAALGAAAGFAGLWLSSQRISMINVQATLAIVSGLVLVGLGLITVGAIPLPRAGLTSLPCRAGIWLKTFLTAPSMIYTFLAGVFTGFIPCGLVYAFVALAASTGSMAYGALAMAAFGLGTVPLMVLTGCGGSLLSMTARSRILQIAACCVIITGIVTIARGAGFLEWPGRVAAGCPLCP